MKFENYFEDAAMNEQRRNLAHEFSESARPVVAPAWRGRFRIPNQNLDIHIAAQVSHKAGSEVLEAAGRMPESLCLEMIRRFDVWPTSFKSLPPNEDSVSLVFFSEGRDEEVLDNLLNYAIYGDFALKAVIGKAELLIFTSLQLPLKLHRIQGKFYFWGVFLGHQVPESLQSDFHAPTQTFKMEQSLSPNSGNKKRFEGKGSTTTISSKDSSKRLVADGDKVERRGRRLDAAWEHAKPLDVLRQKAECIHCGFVSSHGGISRLKAHLGGGHPKIRLSGCPKVPPEVKEVMADWFSEWSKNTKALWTKDINAESAAHVDKGGRPHDASWEESKPSDVAWPKSHGIKGGMSEWAKSSPASSMKKSHGAPAKPSKRKKSLEDTWEHAIPLEETGQATKCRYCGLVCNHGGIARLKAHLGGGDHTTQLEGCRNVPPEVKSSMAKEMKKYKKKSKGVAAMESVGETSLETQRTANQAHWFERRHHVLQETLDEITNTTVKERLQKLLGEKSGNMQKMQFEIQSLQSQLASMP